MGGVCDKRCQHTLCCCCKVICQCIAVCEVWCSGSAPLLQLRRRVRCAAGYHERARKKHGRGALECSRLADDGSGEEEEEEEEEEEGELHVILGFGFALLHLR